MAGRVNTARVGHTATRLADDRVLVVGGSPSVCPGAPDEVFASAELLDGEAVLPAAPLNEPRRFHGAVMLSTGAVLVAGGVPAGAAPSAERYDPGSDTWTRVDDLPRPRQRITLAARGAGGALALGDDDGVLTVDVFHPDGTWTSAPDQPDLYGASPVSLADGRVLLVGRYQSALLSAADATATPVAALPELRDPPAACLLPDGGVLLVANAPTGDFTEAGPVIGPRSWRWDSAADRWDPLGAIPMPGVSFEVHTAPDGMIFARSGNGLWHRFDGAAWDVLAAWDNATPGSRPGRATRGRLVRDGRRGRQSELRRIGRPYGTCAALRPTASCSRPAAVRGAASAVH